MSNIKKIIGVVLALVMALSAVTVAFAATGDKYSVAITAAPTTLKAGETATVEVSVTSNYNVSTMSIPVFFDKTKVTVTDASTTLTGDLKDIKVVTEGDLSKFYKGTSYTEADHGVVALTYVAKQGASIDTYNNTVVMTLKVTALADVTGDAVVECVAGTVKTSTNGTGTLYVGKNSSGTATVDSLAELIDEADLTAATATINIVGAATGSPEIVALANGTGVVDTANKYLYGIEPETADINTVFGATNNGTLRMAAGYAVVGTGTVIELVSADGTVVDSYTVIIFGDVDGDGVLTGADAGKVKQYVGGDHDKLPNPAFVYAGDVDGDGELTGADAGKIKQYVGGDHSKVLQTR